MGPNSNSLKFGQTDVFLGPHTTVLLKLLSYGTIDPQIDRLNHARHFLISWSPWDQKLWVSLKWWYILRVTDLISDDISCGVLLPGHHKAPICGAKPQNPKFRKFWGCSGLSFCKLFALYLSQNAIFLWDGEAFRLRATRSVQKSP